MNEKNENENENREGLSDESDLEQSNIASNSNEPVLNTPSSYESEKISREIEKLSIITSNTHISLIVEGATA